MSSFRYHLPTKIIFGQPAIEALAGELFAANARRALLVSDPGLAQLGLVEQISQGLNQVDYQTETFTQISSNPTTTELAAGLTLAQTHQAQSIIALGGGSAIDIAKAIAMLMTNGGTYTDYQWRSKPITQPSLPLLAVPTTAGTGSEVSKAAVIVDPQNPFKKSVVSPLMFPYAAILDPELTRSLPSRLTAATGMDAFIHALEAYVGRRTNPITDQLAVSALQTVWNTLPRAAAAGDDVDARAAMMLAALWGGTAMDHAGMGLIHALSGPLTGHLQLHHGLANALLLPHVMRFNLPAIDEVRRRTLNTICQLPPDATPAHLVEQLTRFVEQLGLPTRLSELDVSLDNVDWDTIATETTHMVRIGNNPRRVSVADCRKLLKEIR